MAGVLDGKTQVRVAGEVDAKLYLRHILNVD